MNIEKPLLNMNRGFLFLEIQEVQVMDTCRWLCELNNKKRVHHNNGYTLFNFSNNT